MLDAEPVDIFGSAPDLPPEEAPAEEEEEETGKPGEEGKGDDDDEEEEGGEEGGEGDDDDEDVDIDEIDLENEKDPEKLRKAALAHAAASKNKTESIKNLRRARRKTAVAAKAPDVGEFQAPYSQDELTLSKDLPKEKRDSMTENEKQLWDDNVKVKTQLNTDAKEKHDAKVEAAKKAAEEVDDSIVLDDELEDFAKDLALEVGGNKKVANEILKHFNKFDNTGLSEDEVIERINDAFKLTKDYQPPRDQQRKKGKAAKKTAKDPHGVDAIVDSVGSTDTKEPIAL